MATSISINRLMCFTIFWCAAQFASAANYFVSEAGNDLNDGKSTATAWRSLSYAFGKIVSGDSLAIVNNYTINTSVTLSKSGTASAPIIIKSFSTIARDAARLRCVTTTACLKIQNSSYVELQQLYFDGASTTSTSATLLYLRNNHHVTLSNNRFYNAGNYSVHLDGIDNNDNNYRIANNQFFGSYNTPLYLLHVTQLDVSGNTIDNVINGDGIVIVTGKFVTLQQNIVRNVLRVSQGKGKEGIKIRPSQDVTIKNNQIENVSGLGIHLTSEYDPKSLVRHQRVNIVGNIVTQAAKVNQGNNDPECNRGGWPSALHVSRTDDVLIEANTVYENFGEGIILSNVKRGTLRLNDAHDNFGVNYYLNNTSDTSLDRNQAINLGNENHYRCGSPAGGISMANETDINWYNYLPLNNLQITNNILVNSRFGISFFVGDAEHYHPSGLTNVSILNNTVYKTYNAALAITNSTVHNNNYIQSNIWAQPVNGGPLRSVPATGFNCLANLWSTSLLVKENCRSISDVIGDPEFVNAGGNGEKDYMLSGKSPAIDAAQYSQPQPSLWWDYFGNRRGFSPWDIGAHEYIFQ